MSMTNLHKTLSKKTIFFLVILFSVVHSIILAAFLPPLFDEAYYHSWSKYFSLGYFDHPPMVAWLEQLFSSWHGWIPSFRIVSIIVSFLLLGISSAILKACRILTWKTFLVVYGLSQFSLAGIALKTIYTPDTPLILFWSCCLFGLIAAKRYHLSWLIFAAVCFGLACISKYTAVLLGPCILFTLYLLKDRKMFGAYLAGSILFFVLTIAPHIYWLSNNQFISVTAQLSHGLSGKVKSSIEEETFPKIKTESKKIQLVNDALNKLELPEFKPYTRRSKLEKAPERLGNVFGGFALLWGGFLFLILFQWLVPTKENNKIEPETRKILLVASLFPLGFFCMTSLLAKVEANWLSIAIPGLLPLASQFLQYRVRAVFAVALLHILLSFGLLTHAMKPFIPIKKDRLLYETKGYKELSHREDILELPCFTHSYQMASMMTYYNEESPCIPYLGYARFSQFDIQHKDKKIPKKFQFVTHHSLGYKPNGYDLKSADIMLICKKSPPITVNIFELSRLEKPCDYSHYFLRYEFEESYATPR